MKVYVAGKITGCDRKKTVAKFEAAKEWLESQGHEVLVPTILPQLESMSQDDYLHICYAMIDCADCIYMLNDWQHSQGARKELQYASDWRKEIIYQDKMTVEDDYPIIHGVRY